MASYEDAIVHVTGQEKDTFGTAFAIHKDQHATYFLTCAHVVRKEGGNAKVYNWPAEVVPDLGTGVDLAVLRVENSSIPLNFTLPILELDMESPLIKDLDIESAGFYREEGGEPFMQFLNGRLTSRLLFPARDARIAYWNMEFTGLQLAQRGHSGSPVIDLRTNLVVAVITHELSHGREGRAITIDAIKYVWADIRKLAVPRRIFLRLPRSRGVDSSISIRSETLIKSGTTRSSAPEPDDRLLKAIRAQTVVPFIGAGLSMARLPGMPNAQELVRALKQTMPLDEGELDKLKRFLAAEVNPSAVARFAQAGDFAHYRQLRAILNPIIDRRLPPSPPHTFLNALEFPRYITGNVDRLLEHFLLSDYEVITASDTDTLRYLMHYQDSRFILKLHGDISRPETIAVSQAILREIARPSGGEFSERAVVLNDFLRDVFNTNTVLFLGTSLKDQGGFYKLMPDIPSLWGKPSQKHYALVEEDKTGERAEIRNNLQDNLKIQMIEYRPDSMHSQVWEFISYLNTGEKREPVRGRPWSQFFMPRQRFEYLDRQLSLERTAQSICFLTPDATNAIAPDEYLSKRCREDLLKNSKPETRADDELFMDTMILPAMQKRRDNLVGRLTDVNDKLEVRVLFLESELRNELPEVPSDCDRTRIAIDRYRELIKLATTTDEAAEAGGRDSAVMHRPRLKVKLISSLTEDDLKLNTSSYALIFNSEEPEPFADIAIAMASQATRNLFAIHTVQINTSDVDAKVAEFERVWTAAKNEQASIDLIRDLIDKAAKHIAF